MIKEDKQVGVSCIVFDCLNIKRGGGETVALRLIEQFATDGFVVHAIIVAESLKANIELLSNDRITVHYFPVLASTIKCLSFRHVRFQNFVSELAGDIVFSFNYWTPWRGMQVTYHINATPFFPTKEVKRLVGTVRSVVQPLYSKLAITRSEINIFESYYLLDLAVNRYGKSQIVNPEVLYTGIDMPVQTQRRTNLIPRIISVTSGASHKRNDLVVELHRRLQSSGFDVELMFVGDEKAIEKSLRSIDVEYVRSSSLIRFLGYLSREKLYAELAEATVLVSCSEVESFFMVPVEAMAVGCPVICSDFSSIRESVGDAGIVTTAGDIDQMERWVIRLLDESVRDKWSSDCITWSKKFNAKDCSELIVSTVTSLVST